MKEFLYLAEELETHAVSDGQQLKHIKQEICIIQFDCQNITLCNKYKD
jgi:hypothetical protein